MYNIIQKRKIWLSVSSGLAMLSLASLLIFGLNFGIDFKGGSLLELQFSDIRPDSAELEEILTPLEIKGLSIQPVGEDGLILRFEEVREEKHQEILAALRDFAQLQAKQDYAAILAAAEEAKKEALKTAGTTEENIEKLDEQSLEAAPKANVEELRFNSVGPSIGAELKKKAIYSMFIVLLAIILFVAWAFRKVSKPVASWKYGVVAIVALFHDILVIMGVFAFLGQFGTEINTPFIAALLTVLGYSVNDTIVVFDRLRENLPQSDEDFEGTVNTSVNQTLKRSINTSITTLLVLLSVYFFGGHTIKEFILALSIGVFIGAYSSIFLASPLLVVIEKLKK